MANGAFCVMGAMVGAGFASGREVMAFFSRYGGYSWALIALCVFCMAGMTYWMMARAQSVRDLTPGGKAAPIGRAAWALLFALTGGAMTAAAGEMAALTVPIRFAREIGAGATLLLCVFQRRRAGRIGAAMGKLLLPALVLALLLCLSVSGESVPTPSWTLRGAVRALLCALGYGSLNVTLSAAVICEAGRGKSKIEKRKTALLCGALMGALLLLSNAVLLRHAALREAALPTVALLNRIGKEGYYLCAATLYLAIATTLTAQVRGLSALLPEKGNALLSAAIPAAASLIGFEGIVGAAYPLLGWAAAVMAALSLGVRKKPPAEARGG